jgi:urease accessory protein
LTGHASYPAAFAIAASHWGIAPFDALRGLMWTVVESQVTAAIRLVPLGHTAGQRILIAAVDAIETAAQKAATLSEEDIGNMAPTLAMASAWHETQYSRLFRS